MQCNTLSSLSGVLNDFSLPHHVQFKSEQILLDITLSRILWLQNHF
jgi:hypothetical protein